MLEIGNKAQQENGYYAVKCLSLKAQAAYEKSNMAVYEYWPADVSHLRPFGPRYAIEWGEHFKYDLTEAKLETFLEHTAEEWEDAETLAVNLCGIIYDSVENIPDLDAIINSIVQARQFDQKELYKLLKGIGKARAGISFYYLTERDNINRLWREGITDPDGILLEDSKQNAEQYAGTFDRPDDLTIIKIRIPPKDKTPIKVITLDGMPGLFHLYTGKIPSKYLEGYYTRHSGIWI